MSSTTTLSPLRLRILMLHGYTQSGPLFHAKTRALEKSLHKAFPSPSYDLSLHYPTAPIRIHAADIPGATSAKSADGDESGSDAWGWWVRRGDAEPYTYHGMEEGFARIAEVLEADGPFDGVIGFSQGGAAAGMLASLLEPNRRAAFEARQKDGGMRFPSSFEKDTGFVTDVVHLPLSFAVSYSGFGASTNPLYTAFYEPKIQTRMLHFLGSVDTVVEEKRSLRLVDATVEGRGKGGKRVVVHPGGHFVPSSAKGYVAVLVDFLKEVMEKGDGEGEGSGAEKKGEEGLDDFPF